MSRRGASERRLQDRSLFMVETYRSAGELTAQDPLVIDGVRVLGAIDIPGDEVTLYLVDAPNAVSAEHVVLRHGMRTIRVVDVRWEIAGIESMTRIRESPDVAGAESEHLRLTNAEGVAAPPGPNSGGNQE